MKLQVNKNKKWWQFWVPSSAEVDEAVVRSVVWPSSADNKLSGSILRGRVVRSKHRPIYDPAQKAKGGRIVRAMPRQLREIKEGQEGTPTVNGIPLNTPKGQAEERRVWNE